MPTTVTINGEIILPAAAGNPTTIWTLGAPIIDQVNNEVVQTGPRSFTVASNGTFSAPLWATTEHDPIENFYKVELAFDGEIDHNFTQYIVVDHLDGGTQEFSDLTRVLGQGVGSVGVPLSTFLGALTQEVVTHAGPGDYTLTAADENRLLVITSGTALQVLLPAGLALGSRYDVLRWGAGAITFAATGGATFPQPWDQILTQYKGATLQVVQANAWWGVGDLT